jgi:hypothetical protein
MKKLLMAVLLVAGLACGAWAANADQLTITLTPNVNANVAITTTTVKWQNVGVGPIAGTGLDLGGLDLGATVYMIQPATFTMTGSYATMEVEVQAVANSMGAWTFDADGTAEENQLQVYALMSATTKIDAPGVVLDNYDDGSTGNTGDQIIATPRRYGRSGSYDGTFNSVYQKASYDGASEHMANNDQRHMWLRADLPPSTTDTGARSFSVVLTAQITE